MTPPIDPRLDLALFATWLSPEQRPWRPFRWLRYLAAAAQDCVLQGGSLLVNVPPQHGKSMLLAKWLPAWILETQPEKRVMYVSFEGNVAGEWGQAVRDLFAEHGGRRLRTRLREDSEARSTWKTQAGGGMVAVGIGGAVTGRPADVLLLDDPYKGLAEALSPAIRRQVELAWESKLLPRLQKNGARIVLHTRWAEDDLSGKILSGPDAARWRHIRLPALAEENDLLGRAPGAALCPQLHPQTELEQLRDTISTRVWEGVYQQRPQKPGGNVFRRELFKFYDSPPLSPTRVFQSWDLSFGGGPADLNESGSWVVGHVYAKSGDGLYLLHEERFRGGFTQQIEAIRRTLERFPDAKSLLIEAKANGPAVIDALRAAGIRGIVPVEPKGSKEIRAEVACAAMARLPVYVPARSAFTSAVLDEWCVFPNGAHDDRVDVLTQAVDHVARASKFRFEVI